MEDRTPEAPVTDSTAAEDEWNVEADAIRRYNETRRLYAKGRHDDAVGKRVAELVAADSDIPPPADQEALLENMTQQMFTEAKKAHLENVARQRALKMFDEWKASAPQFECPHPWHQLRDRHRETSRCPKCGGIDSRKLRSA